MARESVTGSSSHREEEFAQLKRECLLLRFLDNSSAAFFGFIHCKKISAGERDQALRDCAELRGFNADLGEYKKTIEQQLEQADKKIAKQLHTIQKLNHDKDWRDEEIFNLEEVGRVVVNMVEPL